MLIFTVKFGSLEATENSDLLHSRLLYDVRDIQTLSNISYVEEHQILRLQ